MPGRRQPTDDRRACLVPKNHAGRDDHAWWVSCWRTRRSVRCWCWTEARELATFLESEYFLDRISVSDEEPYHHREVVGFQYHHRGWRAELMGY